MTNRNPAATPPPLYDPAFEHGACGVGFIARVSGEPSHELAQQALTAVSNLGHRGALDADGKSGDGAGVLTQLPLRLLDRERERLGLGQPRSGPLAVGMIFLPQGSPGAVQCANAVEEALERRALRILGWREVPVDPTHLGDKARATQPNIQQVLVGCPETLDQDAFERALYLARRTAEHRLWAEGFDDFYIPSMSSRTVVYKGLMAAPQLGLFYLDLADPDYETALALFHQRYSTNTFPNWQLAQPFRMLAHNGEINTLHGNRNWMRAREAELGRNNWEHELARLRPTVWERGSDSASLDDVVQLLEQSGRDVAHAMMMLVPEAWESAELSLAEKEPRADPLHPSFRMPSPLTPEVRAFYAYHACLAEPWDGPAALTFADGVVVGALLDRNGLRPCRYKITDDGLVTAASEVGVLRIHDGRVVEKGRIGPGQMILVDTRRHLVLKNNELKQEIAMRKPYANWVAQNSLGIRKPSASARAARNGADGANGHANGRVFANAVDLMRAQWAFGYTSEEVRLVVREMGGTGKEPGWSMGDDTPLAVLSEVPRLLYGYMKQRFAQVTNPPIDALREELVMSLQTHVGRRGSWLDEQPELARLLRLDSAILFEADLAGIMAAKEPALKSHRLAVVFDPARGSQGLEQALLELGEAAETAVREGCSILLLSDRDVGPQAAPIPMLLAVGAVHHHLIRQGLRLRADLLVEAGDAWDVHHFAVLIGYGAAAIHPWLALETARSLAGGRGLEELTTERAEKNFRYASEKGLLKIMSKMGISAIASYRGAQIFEALGLSQQVVDRCLTGTPSRIGGIGFAEIAADVLARHADAFGQTEPKKLPDFGLVSYKREGEYHGWEPPVVRAMHQATLTGDYGHYKEYSDLTRDHPPVALRDLIEFRQGRRPVPLSSVEPMEAIRRRFITTAMSLGALSPEAHRTLAIAMNRIGARSNSGEGGEDPGNYVPLPNGDIGHNRIKQVASARFGVNAQYLVMADELEIKMAQGSKPGEGGQLPGIKVTDLIAKFRHAVPGISLISPPPHHDIYSIEDLAQLIYDLKQGNPRAKVGVKLVSEAGVGTIAAGVAKAYADYVLISGDSGGTGSSPLSSIKNAGCPWELGLAETQQVLVFNGLRSRLSVRTDGGVKTGRNVVMAAMLGAEEFGFGTAAVVAIGCDMARQCHLNTCPTGVATQRPDLRAKFEGRPEMAIHYFTHLAEEVRETLAELGFRSLEHVVGRVDLLKQVESPPGSRAASLDLSAILASPSPNGELPIRRLQERNDRPSDETLEPTILEDAAPALDGTETVQKTYRIRNAHRAVGATLAGEIARRHGAQGLEPGAIELRFRGSAGQSFGAFAAPGMRLILEGEANDYVGKGLCGGEIIVRPPDIARFDSHQNVIIGNTVLYGATGGKLFAAGRAGERFAVRNSGAEAVVEGVGDHGCEYMTSGKVVVLGPTGRNFGAGMTNGVAYVLDDANEFPDRYNPELVKINRVATLDEAEELYGLIQEHFDATGSLWAQEILDAWEYYRGLFWRVAPRPVGAPSEPSASETLEKGKGAQPATAPSTAVAKKAAPRPSAIRGAAVVLSDGGQASPMS